MAKTKYKKKKKGPQSTQSSSASPVKETTKSKNISNVVAMDAVDDFDRFEEFFTSNLRTILWLFAILSILVIIGAAVYALRETSESKGADELLAAKTIDEIEKALKTFPTNQAVPLAKLRLATLKFKAGDKKAALDIYSQVASTATPGEARDRAALNKAYTLEALGENKKAAETFERLGSDSSRPEYIRNEANYSAARIRLLEGDKKQAATLLKTIDFSTPGFWSLQGKMLLQRIN